MAAGRFMQLSTIVRMTGRPPEELLEKLPPPSTVTVEDGVAYIWPIEEVTALLPELARQEIDQLKNQRVELQKTVKSLQTTAEHLQNTVDELKFKVERLKREMRSIRPIRNRIDASIASRRDALWPWNPPIPAPKRIHGVYRIMREGETVYIGQSAHVVGRVAEHAKSKDFDQFSYAPVEGGREALNAIESALIITERPPWNHGNDGRLRHPTGHEWTREEAQAVLDKYRSRAAANAA